MNRWSVERKTLAGLVVALLMVVFMAVVAFRAIEARVNSSARLAAAQQRLEEGHQLFGAVNELVSLENAFLVTGDEALLQERRMALLRLQRARDSLTDESTSPAFVELRQLIDREVELLERTLALYDSNGVQGVRNSSVRTEAQDTMRKINLLLGGVVNDQEGLIRRVRQLDEQSANVLYISQFLILAFAFAVLIWLALRIRSDFHERRRAEHLLVETNAFLESLIENLPAIVFAKDAKTHKFVRLNKACENLLGYSREELLGKSDFDFFPPEQAHFFREKDEQVLSQDKIVEIQEEQIDTRDLGRRTLYTRKVPIKNADGEPALLLGISMDITEQKASERRILALNAELEQKAKLLKISNQELESFCYSISHDLRTPLRTIDGFAQMVNEEFGEQLPPAALRYVQRIRHASERMCQLIDGLLAFSRVGRHPLTPVRIDMSMLADKAAEAAAFGRSPAPQIFIGKLPSAWGDEALFYRVWMNLIDNAFKYSARTAQPQVKISAFTNGDFVTYLVKDNGIGFEMAQSNKLFGVFQRLHAGQGFPGTGVGLAIVERIVTRHGGRVWAESRPDEGSTFFFSLPVSANSFANEAVPPPSAETQAS